MIYSRQLYTDDKQRGEYPTGIRAEPKPTPATPSKRVVTIIKTVDTPFGSPYTNVKLNAVCEETGEIVDSLIYRCNAWEVETSVNFLKQAEFAERLEMQGYEIC